MAVIDIKRVRGGRSREAGQFIRLPKEIYRGSATYIPWFDKSMRNLFNKKHSFFRHSRGDFFLALRGKDAVGRIGLFENRNYNTYTGNKDARFYFFDSRDDQESASALFDFSLEWTRERGLSRLIGPQGFTSMSGGGILVEGFEYPSAMTMMGYNHPYYKRLLENWGFEKYKDFVSGYIHADHYERPEKVKRVARLVMKREGFTVPEIKKKKELRSLAEEIGRLYNESWEDHEEFSPLTKDELKDLVDDLMLAADPKLIKVIRKNEELAGFVLTFPDLSEALIRARGRLTPFTLADILLEKRRTKKLIINGLGILPKYRKNGGTALLYYALEESVRALGRDFTGADLTQVAETTDLMLSDVRTLGAEIYKRHRVYQRSVST